jgi:pyruvate/2-oxoglutarate dehydrogenase complex dihydrolipoamide dehydrogenase (E3) component
MTIVLRQFALQERNFRNVYTEKLMSTKTQIAVLGGGPGGYAAAFLAADLGMNVTLIDKAVNPGGVCLYRGCIPSKALLHVAKLNS